MIDQDEAAGSAGEGVRVGVRVTSSGCGRGSRAGGVRVTEWSAEIGRQRGQGCRRVTCCSEAVFSEAAGLNPAALAIRLLS